MPFTPYKQPTDTSSLGSDVKEQRSGFKPYQPTEEPQQKTVPKKNGGIMSFLGEAGKGILKPFATAAVTAAAPIEASARLALGDQVGADKRLTEGYNFPGFGQIKPIGADIGQEGGTSKELGRMFGTGLEIASTVAGGGSGASLAKGAGKASLGSLAKAGAKEGAVLGALGGLGTGIQEDDATIGSAVGSSLLGATLGSALGIALPVVSAGVKGPGKSIWRSIMDTPSSSTIAKTSSKSLASSIEPEVLAATESVMRPHPTAIPLSESQKSLARKAGFDDRVVDLINGASPTDRVKMQRMFEQAESASKSRLVRERPVTIAGESILERVKHVSSKRKQIGKSLGKTVKELPETPLDVSVVRDTLIKNLQDDGVRILDDMEGLNHIAISAFEGGENAVGRKSKQVLGNLDFSESRYANDTAGKKMILQVFDDLNESNGQLSPQRINRIRQRLFDDLDLGSKQEALTGRVESILKNLREELDIPLQNLSKKYAKYSNQYAYTSQALQDFYSLLGKKFSNTNEDILKLRSGEVGSRLMSNASSDAIRVLDSLENAAKKTGMKIKDDVARQFFFSEVLNDLFQITQPRSFQGGIERGAEQALEKVGIGMDIAKGNIAGAAGKIYAKVTKLTPERQKAILKQLLGS